MNNLHQIRNKLFKNVNENDNKFLEHAYIVGLFEGDGFFSITKKGKYITY
jgi:hypothetical protein